MMARAQVTLVASAAALPTKDDNSRASKRKKPTELEIVGQIRRTDRRPDRILAVEPKSAKTYKFSGRVRRPF